MVEGWGGVTYIVAPFAGDCAQVAWRGVRARLWGAHRRGRAVRQRRPQYFRGQEVYLQPAKRYRCGSGRHRQKNLAKLWMYLYMECLQEREKDESCWSHNGHTNIPVFSGGWIRLSNRICLNKLNHIHFSADGFISCDRLCYFKHCVWVKHLYLTKGSHSTQCHSIHWIYSSRKLPLGQTHQQIVINPLLIYHSSSPTTIFFLPLSTSAFPSEGLHLAT